MREAPWSAVAAATAFPLWFIREWSESQNKKGGSCCYRTPRRASPAMQARKAILILSQAAAAGFREGEGKNSGQKECQAADPKG